MEKGVLNVSCHRQDGSRGVGQPLGRPGGIGYRNRITGPPTTQNENQFLMLVPVGYKLIWWKTATIYTIKLSSSQSRMLKEIIT